MDARYIAQYILCAQSLVLRGSVRKSFQYMELANTLMPLVCAAEGSEALEKPCWPTLTGFPKVYAVL